MEKEKLNRISELTAISRKRELSDAEKTEREALRNEYRRMMTSNIKNTLDNTYIMDENGNKRKVTKSD